MSANLDPLIRDLIEWVAKEPRTVAEVLDAWRTSCPRLTVWEDALERGFLTRTWSESAGACVHVTPAGHQFMAGNAKAANTAAAISP
jgi:hypothetical protein